MKRSHRRFGRIRGAVVVTFFASLLVAAASIATASSLPASNFGYCGGDDWEPEIAVNGSYVYGSLAHYPGNPTCDPASGGRRNIFVRVSSDGGTTFGPLTQLPNLGYPELVDTVIIVDPVTGDVYNSYLGFGFVHQTDVIVAKSTDHGQTWTATKINGPLCTDCDHPWIVAKGGNVYVTYAQGADHYLSRSSDGGATWHESLILTDTHVAFPEGGVLDGAGNAWFAWGDCSGNCTGNTAATYRVSRTLAGTSRTRFATVALGAMGPKCPPSVTCGFAYWGPQDDIAIDGAGNLYLLWQDSVSGKPHRPPILRLSECDAGLNCARSANWHRVGRADDKRASGCANGDCYALYPRIEGRDADGAISIMWMDDRLGDPLDHSNGWNVWYRTSTTGGETWSGPSTRVSQYDPARSESHPNGFEFPYGDYQGITFTSDGDAAMIWGEGHNYTGGPDNPGHVIYRRLAV
jgi:hypothetical protein